VYYYPKLRDLREDRDLSQKAIGDLLKTSQQQYYKYEKGIQELPLHHAITLAHFYGVPLDYLVSQS